MARQHEKRQHESEEEKMLRFAKDEFREFNNVLNNERDENQFLNSLKTFIEKNSREISSSQLRNIFSRIKNLNENRYKEVYTIRPKLAYVYGRSDNYGMKKLLVTLDYIIQKIDSEEKLKMFKDFFEAVIAYHKFYGGSN